MAQEPTTLDQRMTPTRQRGERTANRPVFIPPTDIYETPDSIVVLAEMPGAVPESVDLTLDRRVLTIRARAQDHAHPGYQEVYSEYSDGDYERVFTLSEEIDRERIEASYKEGVLRLVLPKAEGARPRKIELKS